MFNFTLCYTTGNLNLCGSVNSKHTPPPNNVFFPRVGHLLEQGQCGGGALSNCKQGNIIF